MKKIKQCFSLNLLSLLGYAFIIFSLLIFFYFYPQAIEESLKDGPTDNFEVTVGHVLWFIEVVKYFLLIEIVLFVLRFIELTFYKNKQNLYDKIFNKIPDVIKKIHTLLFFTGIIFASIPIFLLIFYILCFIIESIFLY